MSRTKTKIEFPARSSATSSSEDSRQVLLVPEAMIAGICRKCKAPPFYVASRIGLMCCPHCGASEEHIRFGWGKQQIIFIPEDAGSEESE